MVCVFQLPLINGNWLAKLKQSLQQAPVKPRKTLFIGAAQIGSIEKDRAVLLQEAGLLRVGEHGVYLDEKRLDAQLADIANWLAEHDMADQWRNELLSVTDESGKVYAAVERAAARPLGIRTLAVHLVGRTVDGDFWLQQRVSHKSVDPNKLDTLAGGLVSAGESLAVALERETQEEAGLILKDLPETSENGQFSVCQPVNPEVEGYMVENGFWYERQIPNHMVPVNQDGEVSGFVKLSPQCLLEQMYEGRVASIACLIFARLFWTDVRK